jgi:hypothetical protein
MYDDNDVLCMIMMFLMYDNDVRIYPLKIKIL